MTAAVIPTPWPGPRREPGACSDPVARAHQREVAEALACAGPALDRAAEWGRELAGALSAGGKLLVAGNGGSAAQAQHLTAELVGRYWQNRPGFSAISLHSDTSSLTAIVNDFGAEELFARQVQAHGAPGDVLLLMSTSGRSSNLLAAAGRGRECGLRVWAMTGPLPNPLAQACDETSAVPVPVTGLVQEIHLVAVHVMCAAFDRQLEAWALATAEVPA